MGVSIEQWRCAIGSFHPRHLNTGRIAIVQVQGKPPEPPDLEKSPEGRENRIGDPYSHGKIITWIRALRIDPQLLVVIAFLLLIGGVEANPGPLTPDSDKGTELNDLRDKIQGKLKYMDESMTRLKNKVQMPISAGTQEISSVNDDVQMDSDSDNETGIEPCETDEDVQKLNRLLERLVDIEKKIKVECNGDGYETDATITTDVIPNKKRRLDKLKVTSSKITRSKKLLEELDDTLEIIRQFETNLTSDGSIGKTESLSPSTVEQVKAFLHEHVTDTACQPSVDDRLTACVKKHGLQIVENNATGDCLFEALAQQLDHLNIIALDHRELRNNLVSYVKNNYIMPNKEHVMTLFDDKSNEELKNYMFTRPDNDEYDNTVLLSWYTESYMNKPRTWGDTIMIWACTKLFNVNVKIYTAGHDEPYTLVPTEDGTMRGVIKLGYISELHFVGLVEIK
ncbi:unnamed protein product, partial [Owenia fusiformis]